MAKARKTRKIVGRSSHPVMDPSVLAEPTPDARRLALKLDALVGSSANLKAKPIEGVRGKIMGGWVRDTPLIAGRPIFTSPGVGLTWPDTLYVPRNQRSVGLPRPPVSRLYTDAWKDAGASTADMNTGAIFAFAGARTTEPAGFGEAGLGIRFSPVNTLVNVRYEPEVNCAITYRGFVDFWPQLIAGNVRLQGWLIAAAWQLNPVLGGSFELFHQKAFLVFDTGDRDAFNGAISPNITMFQKNFSGSALATTFPLQGGRTYVLGIVAWVKANHNVTTSNGKVIPHDGLKFKLYSQLVCAVPYMSAYTQVLIP